jgi:hypothetical protein
MDNEFLMVVPYNGKKFGNQDRVNLLALAEDFSNEE